MDRIENNRGSGTFSPLLHRRNSSNKNSFLDKLKECHKEIREDYDAYGKYDKKIYQERCKEIRKIFWERCGVDYKEQIRK